MAASGDTLMFEFPADIRALAALPWLFN